jgi:hypothetical protein
MMVMVMVIWWPVSWRQQLQLWHIIIGTIICSGGGGGIRSGSLLLLGIARIEPDYGIDDNI